MITSKKAANAVGGKTARACDSCVRKRARWYCAADDAFLCQGCDSSVHSANQLASRHERVLLETPSNYKPATWHEGFTRKARTPRHAKQTPPTKDVLPLVPEMVTEELALLDENEEEQLHYRVPVFDPFDNNNNNIELDDFSGFLPSDVELAEFAADVESLLGRGLDEGMEGLGPLLDCKEEDGIYDICIDDHEGRISVKVEDEELEASHLDWNFGYESSLQVTGDEEKVVAGAGTAVMESECKGEVRRKICLRLNYESVIAAWASQGSPWTTGSRPEFNPDDCWPDFMGMCTTGVHHPNGGIGGHVRGSDGGREERVSRYREKRRTRLFSKKIRYEVRKLNAEKRPRMKGRFVKRASLAGSAFPYLMNK